MVFLPNIFVTLKKLSLEYQPYACGDFFSQALILNKNPHLWTNTSLTGVHPETAVLLDICACLLHLHLSACGLVQAGADSLCENFNL